MIFKKLSADVLNWKKGIYKKPTVTSYLLVKRPDPGLTVEDWMSLDW